MSFDQQKPIPVSDMTKLSELHYKKKPIILDFNT
jgi:hypothetical protein